MSPGTGARTTSSLMQLASRTNMSHNQAVFAGALTLPLWRKRNKRSTNVDAGLGDETPTVSGSDIPQAYWGLYDLASMHLCPGNTLGPRARLLALHLGVSRW